MIELKLNREQFSDYCRRSPNKSLKTTEEWLLFRVLARVNLALSPSFAVSIEKRENERFLPLNSRHLRGEKTVGGVWDNLPTFRRVLA